MKKTSNILWGVALVAIGIIFSLNALEIADVNLFFDGWWTLFIIIPCIIGIFTNREKTGNIIGVAIGILLLLSAQDVISFRIVWRLFVPAVILVIGANMIYKGFSGNKANEIIVKLEENGAERRVSCATFSGNNIDFDGEIFEGVELIAVFGSVKCDLRKAIIVKDCVIEVSATFGAIEIFVPETINVKVNANGIFGGVSNKTKNNKNNQITLYVNGLCMFGGVDIK